MPSVSKWSLSIALGFALLAVVTDCQSQESQESKSPQNAAEAKADKTGGSIAAALVFQSTMNSVTDCNLFAEDGWHYKAESLKRKKLEQQGALKGVAIKDSGGVSGDCLQFANKTKEVILYKSKLTADFYPRPNWEGSISFFLKCNPDRDLGDDYCDPIQIAGRKWNDASIWCDFDKTSPRTFRMGVFSDFAHWNPTKAKYEEIPKSDLPIITVVAPPFSHTQWTHVLMTFQNINSTDGKKGTAKLYLNGELQGKMERDFKLTWNEDDPMPAIMMGLNYVGGFDELSIYNRALTDKEAMHLNRSTRE
ncbi:MAG: LamG-like jellyroll fold domain-containing protein [Mariniblastus sp.]